MQSLGQRTVSLRLKRGALGGSSPSLSGLLSSAARSSLFTILLLQPVFFLRSRPTRESVREVMVKVMVDCLVRGPLQELALGRLTPTSTVLLMLLQLCC